MPAALPPLLLAEKGYDEDAVRQDLLLSGIVLVMRTQANRKNPPLCDFKAYQDRNSTVAAIFGPPCRSGPG